MPFIIRCSTSKVLFVMLLGVDCVYHKFILGVDVNTCIVSLALIIFWTGLV